jgi:hypothetical protein
VTGGDARKVEVGRRRSNDVELEKTCRKQAATEAWKPRRNNLHKQRRSRQKLV